MSYCSSACSSELDHVQHLSPMTEKNKSFSNKFEGKSMFSESSKSEREDLESDNSKSENLNELKNLLEAEEEMQ